MRLIEFKIERLDGDSGPWNDANLFRVMLYKGVVPIELVKQLDQVMNWV